MANYWKTLWQRVSAQDAKVKAEVERIAVLQQTAADRRAEYAEEKERASLAGDASLSSGLASSRTRMASTQSKALA